jgi:hypothetical protein
MWRSISPLVLVAALGCADEDLGAHESALVASARDGEVVLDVRSDGAALFGTLEEVPEHSDGDRVLVVRSELGGAPFAGSLDGTHVLDARFADGGIVAIGADHVLRFYDARGVVELDAAVTAPLSVAGSTVAYARGEMPDFEIARADVRTGAVMQVTRGMAPAWSPALSPDGTEVLFVSSAEGSPRLYRHDGGSARALARTQRFPTSPRAPRWDGAASLEFEDEEGRARLELASGRIENLGRRMP